jgi:probable HAF family extracellular repeat protein
MRHAHCAREGTTGFAIVWTLLAAQASAQPAAERSASGGAVHSVPMGYLVTTIGTLPGGGNSHASAINSVGWVAGTATDVNNGYNDRAVLYTGGGLINLGVLDVPYPLSSQGLALNNAGQVVGETSNGVGHAFLYSEGRLTNLETLPATVSSQALAINNTAQIVGTVAVMLDPSTVQWHAFTSDGRTMTDLTARLGGPDYSEAHGINDAGVIVGWCRAAGSEQESHAFILDATRAIDLGTLGGPNSGANAINSGGQVVGWSYLPSGNATHPFLYAGGHMTDLGLLPGATSAAASAVNSGGVVVGTALLPGWHNTRAFVYVGGALRDLNTMIAPTSGWVLKQADAMNDAGEIVGTGTLNGAILGFVLHPVYAARPR